MALNSKNEILLSFPITSDIAVLDTKGKLKRKFGVKSKYIEEIPFFSAEETYAENSTTRNWEKEKEYSLSTSDYSALGYNNYLDIYYRIVYIRPTLEQVKLARTEADFSIIIFDNEFKKMGETDILSHTKYDPDKMMVTNKGLAVARVDLYNQNENKISFGIFN